MESWIHSELNKRTIVSVGSIILQSGGIVCKGKTTVISNRSSDDFCCDIGQIDRLFIIELFPLIVLSSDNTNCKNDIQLFHQLFDELSVYRDYH